MIKIYIQAETEMLELRQKVVTALKLLRKVTYREKYEIILDSPDGLRKIKSRQ